MFVPIEKKAATAMRQIVSEMQAQQRMSAASKNSETANTARFERYRLLMDLYKATGQVYARACFLCLFCEMQAAVSA